MTSVKTRLTRRLRAKSSANEMTVLEHLEELRTRLFRCLLAFAVGSAVGWFVYGPALTFLISPLRKLPESDQILSGGRLIFTAPAEAFFIRLKVTAFIGFVIALPVILWQVWRFVTPGLYKNERRYALPFVLSSMLLFGAGIAFAFATLPRALELLAGFAPPDVLILLPRASDYLSFVLLLVGAFGLAFEMPLLLLALTLIGILSSKSLRRGRKIAVVAILFSAAVITPTQDPITMLMMAVPLILLYEATILVARLMKK